MSERFKVSYPFPIALSAIFWLGMWALLAVIHEQGGLRSCGIPSAFDPLVNWALYLIAAFAGPVSLLSYSSSLEIEGDRLLWKRWFGLSSLAFDRTEIHEARVERTSRSRQLRFVLASGPTIRFTQFASGFSRLGRYLGALPDGR